MNSQDSSSALHDRVVKNNYLDHHTFTYNICPIYWATRMSRHLKWNLTCITVGDITRNRTAMYKTSGITTDVPKTKNNVYGLDWVILLHSEVVMLSFHIVNYQLKNIRAFLYLHLCNFHVQASILEKVYLNLKIFWGVIFEKRNVHINLHFFH